MIKHAWPSSSCSITSGLCLVVRLYCLPLTAGWSASRACWRDTRALSRRSKPSPNLLNPDMLPVAGAEALCLSDADTLTERLLAAPRVVRASIPLII